jgi:hypothetical protein
MIGVARMFKRPPILQRALQYTNCLGVVVQGSVSRIQIVAELQLRKGRMAHIPLRDPAFLPTITHRPPAKTLVFSTKSELLILSNFPCLKI